jgi:hypothetical protein
MRHTILASVISFLTVLLPSIGSTSESSSPPTVEVSNTIHFTLQDGSDVSVSAGTYRVEAAAGMNLRLVAETTQATREIPATSFTHEETLTAPLAFAVHEQEQEDAVHLLLLLPGGQGLDAAGRAGEVQTRGGEFLLRSRSQYTGVVMQQGRVKLDKDIQNETDQINQMNTKMNIHLYEASDAKARLGRCDICKILNEMRK